MKQVHTKFLPLLFVLLLCFSMNIVALADGDGNLDGSSGGMGSGTSTDVWYNQDGVRVTVVTADGSAVSNPFDLTNTNVSSNIIHFGKVSKLKYKSGTALSLSSATYSCTNPSIALPCIVSGRSSKASIEAIKRYFCSEYAARLVAAKTGISYEDFISGKYKLLIEPIAFFIHGGVNYAMTATEAALFNQKNGGTLRSKLPSLTHQNLPLSMYLEFSDLGYPAWSGTTSGKVTDSEIISALGIGIVSYTEVPETGIEAPDYTYRVDIDVITSITLTSSTEVNPKNPASVTFHINGAAYTVNNIVMPKDGSQVVWAKWHTPSAPTTLTIHVSVNGASTGKTTFTAKIVDLEENIPPDPLATDTNPHFTVPSVPSNAQRTSASWSIWSAWWEEDWTWESNWKWISTGHVTSCLVNCSDVHGYWKDNGEWVDLGEYVFGSTVYSASLSGSMSILPDDVVPTASDKNMSSGYGIKESVTAKLSVNAPAGHYASAQTAISFFPEFKYQYYCRLLSGSGGTTKTFTFRPNEYSTYNRNVHFVPVWYPDGTSYTVYTYVIDLWTPSGMLSINLNDSVQIQGSLYDDWFTKRE